jgi:hypothetical protein
MISLRAKGLSEDLSIGKLYKEKEKEKEKYSMPF